MPIPPAQVTGSRRVAAVQRVGAIGADEQAGSAARFRQPLEEGDALGVGPVQVVEHDQARYRTGENGHDLEPEPNPFVGRALGRVQVSRAGPP